MFQMCDSVGICSNCIHSNACEFEKVNQLRKTTVWDCGEHETGDFKGRENNDAYRVGSEEKIHEGVPGRDTGLCLSCENRVKCRLPKNSAGVWHCEEYA